ncbi:cob(I)yrinic acid a,c-diamide adenosyltransferase [Proteiniclasticum sp. SCR006]|uniref:Cob(I)yrinic acid a,c-diamide adenosyltransferase n=1 Tax=Proteiniclasticum aestuarii TaxID=2817862 RepID=A0A939H5F9_9CLOT|nr:cob(I)yrinic acid a,c-diamide adenosyltransferase [Proteiniclasticum aestuarii]MBO1263481.1 cob(I)yrinic acid a,c-diamide adenosyltransferase [Proteiniclasticum aestuarii]
MNKGFVQIYTGEGKGKTTAALGLSFRAAGRGKKVLFVQFLKGIRTGEEVSMGQNEQITHLKLAETVRFFHTLSEEEQGALKSKVKGEWIELMKRIETEPMDILVLDEIMAAMHHGLVEEADVIKLLETRPPHMEVILTGRDPSDRLMQKADLVTEMVNCRHYYSKGVSSRVGIEY